MNNLPDGARGRILAVSLCFLVGAVIYLAIVAPLIGLYDHNAMSLREQANLVRRLQVSVQGAQRSPLESDRSPAQSQDGALLLTGSTAMVAAATLQSAVKQFLESSGAKLNSSEILAVENRDQFQRVGIHVQFGGDLALLMTVLRGIETARPAMFIDNVDIRGAGDATENGGDQLLSITFDLYGFRLSSMAK